MNDIVNLAWLSNLALIFSSSFFPLSFLISHLCRKCWRIYPRGKSSYCLFILKLTCFFFLKSTIIKSSTHYDKMIQNFLLNVFFLKNVKINKQYNKWKWQKKEKRATLEQDIPKIWAFLVGAHPLLYYHRTKVKPEIYF